MTTIRVGTCSWTDRALLREAEWYPKRTMTATERQRFYAEHFSIAEADSTYYAPPSRETATAWAERTPDHFVMNVKAYSLLTGHPTRPESLWPDLREAIPEWHAGKRNVYADHLPEAALDEAWRRFLDGLQPLEDAGKLGPVLFQFPTWFGPSRANREALVRLRHRLGNRRACVELRAPAWTVGDDLDRTLALLREQGLTFVVVDAPKASKLRRVLETTTDDLAVVRFHGRADDTWDQRTGSAAERFRYLYRPGELRAWVPRLHELSTRVGEVHALMNNCYRDYGVRNAEQLQELLRSAATAAS